MKKVLVSIVLMVLYGLCMAKPRIISSEPCEYRDVSCDRYGYQNWFKEEISYSQALEDLDMLVYLLKSSYSGYEDAVKRALKIESIIESFKKSNTENENIKVSQLKKRIRKLVASEKSEARNSVFVRTRPAVNGGRLRRFGVQHKRGGVIWMRRGRRQKEDKN